MHLDISQLCEFYLEFIMDNKKNINVSSIISDILDVTCRTFTINGSLKYNMALYFQESIRCI